MSLFEEYIQLRDSMPSAISPWLRPFFVSAFGVEEALRDGEVIEHYLISVGADFPRTFWAAITANDWLDRASIWSGIEQAKLPLFNGIERLLCYPEATPELLKWAYQAGYKRSVLRHPACSRDVLSSLDSELAMSGGPYREEQHTAESSASLYIALNPSSHAKDLESLLRSTKKMDVLQGIAENPSADTRILSMLWEKYEECHPMLARHPRLAPFLFQEFFQDDSLRFRLAQNTALPEGFALRLCDDFSLGFGVDPRCEVGLVQLALNPGLTKDSITAVAEVAISTHNFAIAAALLLHDRLELSYVDKLKKINMYLFGFDFKRLRFLDARAEYLWRCAQPLSRTPRG